MTAIVVKATLGQDVRRVAIHNNELTYDDLLIMLQRLFRNKLSPSDEVTLKYTDSDGDAVLLTDQNDLLHALEQSYILRLNITVAGKEAPVTDILGVQNELKQVRDAISGLLKKLETLSAAAANAAAATPAGKVDGKTEPKKDSAAAGPAKSSGATNALFDPLNQGASPAQAGAAKPPTAAATASPAASAPPAAASAPPPAAAAATPYAQPQQPPTMMAPPPASTAPPAAAVPPAAAAAYPAQQPADMYAGYGGYQYTPAASPANYGRPPQQPQQQPPQQPQQQYGMPPQQQQQPPQQYGQYGPPQPQQPPQQPQQPYRPPQQPQTPQQQQQQTPQQPQQFAQPSQFAQPAQYSQQQQPPQQQYYTRQ